MIVVGPWAAVLAGAWPVLAPAAFARARGRIVLGARGRARPRGPRRRLRLQAGRRPHRRVTFPDDVLALCVLVAAFTAVPDGRLKASPGLGSFGPDVRTLAGEAALGLLLAARRRRERVAARRCAPDDPSARARAPPARRTAARSRPPSRRSRTSSTSAIPPRIGTRSVWPRTWRSSPGRSASRRRGRPPALGRPAPRPRQGGRRHRRATQARRLLTTQRMGGCAPSTTALGAAPAALPLRRPAGSGRRVSPRAARRLRLLRRRGRRDPARSHFLILADSFDAMTTDRPFRPALTRDAALAEIERWSGTQFHPDARPRLRGGPARPSRGRGALGRGTRSSSATPVRPSGGAASARSAFDSSRRRRSRSAALWLRSSASASASSSSPPWAVQQRSSAPERRPCTSSASRRLSAALSRALGETGRSRSLFERVAGRLERAGASWVGLVAWNGDGLGGSVVRATGEDGLDEAALVSWLVRHGDTGEGVVLGRHLRPRLAGRAPGGAAPPRERRARRLPRPRLAAAARGARHTVATGRTCTRSGSPSRPSRPCAVRVPSAPAKSRFRMGPRRRGVLGGASARTQGAFVSLRYGRD